MTNTNTTNKDKPLTPDSPTVPDVKLFLDIRDQYDPEQDTLSKKAYLCIPVDDIRSGELKSFSGKGTTVSRNFTVLVAILAHMNTAGKSFPSQDLLAELTGLTRQSVSKAISELIDLGLLNRETKFFEGKKARSSYTVNFSTKNSTTTVSLTEEDVMETVEGAGMNSMSLLQLFMDQYEDATGIAYLPNHSRDLGLFKEKLVGRYTDDDLLAGVAFAVANYKDMWASAAYPYITVGMLTSWLFTEALQVIKIEQEEQYTLSLRIDAAEQYTEDDILGMLG